jgi:hypothetical protein
MSAMVSVGGLDFYFENRRTGNDGGPSLQVIDRGGERPVQLLRFDMFDVQPHYHYDPNGRDLRFDLDPLTIDDGIGWAIRLLREKLPVMVAKAGREQLLSAEDVIAIRGVLPDIERRWREEKPVGRMQETQAG